VREVCHELYHSPDTSLVPACYPSPNGVEIVLELQVVRDPSSVSALDLALPVFELVAIHRPQTVNDRVNPIRNLA
jgi:hypothetical protein